MAKRHSEVRPAGFELGIVLQGQRQAGQASRQAAIMLAECSLIMLGVNALLFMTSLLEKMSAHPHRCWPSPGCCQVGGAVCRSLGCLVVPGCLSDLCRHGTGAACEAYLAAGSSPQKLGVVVGGLTASSGLGQTIGSAAGGWLIGVIAHRSYGLLALPLLVMAGLLLARPRWWTVVGAAPAPRAA